MSHFRRTFLLEMNTSFGFLRVRELDYFINLDQTTVSVIENSCQNLYDLVVLNNSSTAAASSTMSIAHPDCHRQRRTDADRLLGNATQYTASNRSANINAGFIQTKFGVVINQRHCSTNSDWNYRGP
jgi:hypothetical protein